MEWINSDQIIAFATYSALLPVAFATFNFKSPDRSKRLLSWLVVFSAIIGISAHIMGYHFGKPNLWLLHVLTIIEFILVSLIYRPYLNSQLADVLLVAFPILAGINSLYIFVSLDIDRSFNVYARSIESFCFMVYSVIFFAQVLKEMKIKNLERHPVFWISCGIILFYATNFFIFIFSGDLFRTVNIPTWYQFWKLHAIFVIVLNVFYTIALWIVNPKV